MKRFAQFTFVACLALASLAASFPYVTLNNKTNRLSDNGSALTFNGGMYQPASANLTNWSALSTNSLGTGSITTNAPAIAAGSIAAFASSNVLGAATSAQLQSALGNVYQATNANLTSVAAGGGNAANWNASGTTNSTIAGVESSNFGRFTNGWSGGGWYNVKDPAFGAVGNGIADDTVAIQAAINAAPAPGGIVYLPPGTYKITNTITLQKSTQLIGGGSANSSSPTNGVTTIDASTITSVIDVMRTPGGSYSVRLQGFTLRGNASTTGPTGLDIISCFRPVVEDIFITGFNIGMQIYQTQQAYVKNVNIDNAKQKGLYISGGSGHCIFIANVFANTQGGFNVQIDDGQDFQFYDSVIDEAFGTTAASVYLLNPSDVSFNNTTVYLSSADGIRYGNGTVTPTRVTLNNVRVAPFSSGHSTNSTIWLRGTGHKMLNVNTVNTNGTVDIVDSATNTVWMNVNGQYKLPGFSSVLSSNTAASLFYCPVASTNRVGGDLVWEAFATDGTDTQAQSGRSHFDAIAKSTNVTATVTSYTNSAAVSTGTFTVALTANTSTNNVCAIQANVTPSLNTTNIVFRWRVDSPLNFTLNPL